MLSKTRDAIKHPVFLPRVWGKGSVGKPLPQPFYGLDTERNTQPGAELGAWVCGWISNARESKPFRTFTDLQPGTYWIWNLGYDIEGMVRDLDLEEGFAMREDGTRFKLAGAECVYYKGKRFEWKDDGGRRIFLEASSFFNRISLKDAVKSLCKCPCTACVGHKKNPKVPHCGVEPSCPTKDPVDASKMSWRKYHGDSEYREIVDKYCAKDALRAFELVSFLAQGFKDLGVEIGGTPGSTAKRFLSNVQPFPRVIWNTHRPFLNAYCGGRFELTRRGSFPDANQFDIVSAYPWALAQCPMLSANATHRSTRRMNDDSLYGAYEVKFTTDEYLGLMPSWKANTRIYTKTAQAGWITKPELEYLASRGHNYEILRGTEIFDDNPTDGWRQLVEPLFRLKDGHVDECPAWSNRPCTCKKKLKGMPKSLGAKVGVNSLYGILIQLIEKGGVWVPIDEAVNAVDFCGVLALEKGPKGFDAGQFYAPCYSATLTAMVRRYLLETAHKVGDEHVVAFHTDAIHFKDGRTMPTSSEMGGWEHAKSASPDEPLIILKSGQYAMGGDVKGRGFAKRKLNPESEDEIAMRQKVDLWAPQHTRRSRVSVRTAKTWREVSNIVERQVENNIGWENKREWLGGNSVRDILRVIQRGEHVDSRALRDPTA